MTSPETPSSPHDPSNDGAPPPVDVPAASPAPAVVPPHAASQSVDEDGPQPGNAAPSAPADHDDANGPAPGNERHPVVVRDMGQERAGATTTGTKRRRRRKKRGGGGSVAPGVDGAPGTVAAVAADGEAPAEGAAEGAEGAVAHEGASDRPPREKSEKKKPRPPRIDRERPAFSVGDVTFGKILEITEDVIFIDLLGKGRGLFDLRELLLPIDDEPGAPEHEEREEEEKDEAAAANVEDMPTATGEPEELAALVAAPVAAAVEATPAVEAEAATSTETATEASTETATEASTATATSTETATPTEAASAEAEKPKHVDPPLPQVILEVGAQFVGVVHNDGGRGGLFVLTHHPRRASKAKPIVAAALKDHTMVQGIVTGVIKGGVEADVDGLRAFVPGSHMDLHLGADLSRYVGKRLDFYVTQYGKRGRDVVLSRKPLLEAEARKAREEALKTLTVGAVVEGTVRSVVAFGAFVDVGGIEGLVELKEMSHNRSDGPNDVFKQGEKVEVKVLRIDDRGKVWLSRKACVADPWGEVAKKYATGTKHKGKVVRIQPFGAFVELEGGIDGLIHAVDLVIPTEKGITGIKRVESINELVKIGDELECVVAHVDPSSHKIGLHPALTGPLAEEAPQKVQQYKPVKAVVVIAEAGGLIVRLLGVTGRNARGYVTSAATGTARGTELRKPFPAGTQIEAKVLEIDPKRGEVKLSIKALSEETERNAFNTYRAQVKTAARFTLGDLLNKKK